MKQIGQRAVSYILGREDDLQAYRCPERHLLPSGKEPVEIGTVRMAGDDDV